MMMMVVVVGFWWFGGRLCGRDFGPAVGFDREVIEDIIVGSAENGYEGDKAA